MFLYRIAFLKQREHWMFINISKQLPVSAIEF